MIGYSPLMVDGSSNVTVRDVNYEGTEGLREFLTKTVSISPSSPPTI
jgi:hypothetical protein